MASKMSVSEIISFEEMLVEADSEGFVDMKANNTGTILTLQKGSYFLLDNSYILLLNGNICKTRK